MWIQTATNRGCPILRMALFRAKGGKPQISPLRYAPVEMTNLGFPIVLEESVPVDHVCPVIDAFVEMLVRSELGLERAEAACLTSIGRPSSKIHS